MSILFFLIIISLGQLGSTETTARLSKFLIGDDDSRIYACSDRVFYAFESNGSIAWSLHLPYSCNSTMPPVHGGRGKIFLIAENRVMNINFLNLGTSPPTADVFLGPEKGQEDSSDIIGLAVSTLSSSVFINVKNKGLFAYMMRGQLLWSAGPVLSQFGYRLGCRKGVEGCFFTSVPMIDRCEASLYISNTAGELYSLSLRSPHYNWVQDLSSYGKDFTVTPGNNGLLYVIIPTKAIVLALGVSMGNVLWQRSVGPLRIADCTPVVDSNGWISIGSLDGFLYSISPSGDVNKFTKVSEVNSVIQVSPFLDCSGYAVYISQAEMEGKNSQLLGDYNYVSALRPTGVVFTLLAPTTGAVYWSESYPGQFLSILSQSDLQHFAVDEGILLAFITASRIGNQLMCRSKNEQLVSTCSQARPKPLKIYTGNSGNEKKIMLFLLVESIVLVVLAGLVRFCCIFWSKKKLQGQDLGNFLAKRRSLQQKKKEYDRTITELEEKAAEAAGGHEIFDDLGDLVRERQGIERKLSTTYSLGRDGTNSQKTNSILPVYDGKSRSYSFQSAKKENVTIFRTLSDSSSEQKSSSGNDTDSSSWEEEEAEERQSIDKAKGKAPIEEAESSSNEDDDDDADADDVVDLKSSSDYVSSSNISVHPMSVESIQRRGRRSSWLKRRRSMSSTN
ncbi:protein GAMETE EXPRESSED 3 [Mercurialis annua]|uniref:protein GAMETE EXPRESSED 3 n=1 Tax=Mercurialis annua TaxID=3986 RepID=UPI0024AF84D4|nr:protein GAMETE EXPRESSED 3 [Mercurialis annua]